MPRLTNNFELSRLEPTAGFGGELSRFRNGGAIRLAPGASVLDVYLEHNKPESSDSILYQFDVSLSASGASDNTRRAYNTDIWLSIAIKLFHYWEFSRNFDPLAEQLAKLHSLEQYDRALEEGSVQRSQAEQFLARMLIQGDGGTPLLESASTKRRASVLHLGKPITISANPEKLAMQLRPTQAEKVPVCIQGNDEKMIAHLFARYAPLITQEFWNQFFDIRSISQVLNHQRNSGNSENTLARKFASLRHFERFLYSCELLSKPTVVFMQRPRVREKMQLTISKDEIDKLKKHFDIDAARPHLSRQAHLLALRNRAIFAVLHYTAIRANALCGLRMQDVDLKQKQIFVREKGRKEALKPLGKWAMKRLEDFLQERSEFLKFLNVKAEHRDMLFHSRVGLPLQRRSLSGMLAQAAREAGIDRKIGERSTFGAHADRRSRAAELHQNGASTEQISNYLQHRYLSTTQIYLRGIPDNLKRISDQFG